MVAAPKPKKERATMNMHVDRQSFVIPKARPKAKRPDPIFKKIEVHRKASAAYEKTCLWEDNFPAELHRRPRVLCATGNSRPDSECYLESPGAIHATLKAEKSFAKGSKAMEQAAEDRFQTRMAGYRADEKALKKAQDEGGFTAARDANEKAWFAKYKAYNSLLRTTPTSAAGAAALALYVAEVESESFDGGRKSAPYKVLSTIAKVVSRLN